jgi:tetratricopeptide (TPR) repeat protein
MRVRTPFCLLTCAAVFAAVFAASAAQPELDKLRSCVERSDAGCSAAALEHVEKQRPLVTNSLEYLELAAQSLLLQRRYEDALRTIEKALSRKPEEFRYLLIQGRIQQELGAHPSAIRSFLLAQKAQPNSPEVYFLIGMSFFIEEEHDRADRHFRHVLQIQPSNHKALFMLGVLHAYRNELKEAGALFAQAVEAQPANAHYRLHWGVLLDRDNKSADALEEVRRAVELAPENAFAQYHLGRLHADRGEMEPARKHLERAVALEPSLAQAHYRLSGVYRKLGLRNEAVQALAAFQKAKAAEQKKPSSPSDSLLLDSVAP